MSEYPPPPPQQPYGGQPPYAAPPKKPRPRAVWFVVGGVLLVLAPVVFLGAIFTVLRPLTQEDAVFRVDETPMQVDLPAGEERAIFYEGASLAQCNATDGSGAPIEFRSVTGEFTLNEWTAAARFDTGDGNVTFSCNSESGSDEVRIAQLPSTTTFVAGLLVGILVPLLSGLVGLIILIVTGILWATRPPRAKKGEQPYGPGTPGS
jgi:hypothetical protein